MNEQRQQAYVDLVNALLSCESGKEEEVLTSQPELVDEGLVTMLLAHAQMLEQTNDPEIIPTSQWLTNFANHLAQELGQNSPSPPEESDSRHNFLISIIQAIADSQGNPQVVYPLLRANLPLLDEAIIPILTTWYQSKLAEVEEDRKQFLTAVVVEFANLIQQFYLGSRLVNLEIAIACYHLALEVFTRDAYPEMWAVTQNNLALVYSNRIRGEWAANLEEAIARYHLALEVRTRDAHPQQWAKTQMNLATAYSERIRDGRAENLEIAIACYHLALEVFTRDAYPEEWADTQNNLANAYSERIRDERAENLEKAIACNRLALEVRTRDAYPEEWADTQNNLANAYSERIRDERAENLEKAIDCYRLALEVHTRDAYPEDWARTHMNLAIAYCNRIRGERAANLEEAIACYRLALEVRTREAYPEQWATTQMNLANAYSDRILGERAANLEEAISDRILGERAANLEKAIDCYRLALEVHTRDAYPEDWARTHMNLANAFSDRIRGERVANLEIAIDCYRLALEVHTRDAYPEDWARTQNNLANAYCNRILGERAANLEEAIDCYRLALEVRTRDAYPEDWATTQMNLAAAYWRRIWGEREENLEKAIECYRMALEVRTRDAYPEPWARTHMNLANAFSDRIRGERVANLEEAIACYRLALEVYTHAAYPEAWAMTQMNLGVPLIHVDRVTEAIECFQSALEIHTLQSFPIDCLRTARNLGNLLFKQGNWQQAIDSYDLAIQAVETSRSWATSEDERQRVIREAINVYENTIQAYINLDQIDKAITTSERARSRQLVDFMQTNDLYANGEIPPEVRELLAKYQDINNHIRDYQNTNSSNNPEQPEPNRSSRNSETFAVDTAAILALTAEKDRIWQQIRQQDHELAGQIQVAPIDLPTIQTLLPNSHTAILSFYTTDNDTQIFIITRDSQPQIHTCQGQGINNFQQWLRDRWLTPYLNDSSTWHNDLPNSLTEIAHRLDLDTLIAKLDNITELIIIPHLYLHQIPFAALPLNPLLGGVPEGRGGLHATAGSQLLLGDRFTIRYAPSCQILKYCTDRPAIVSPQYGTIEDADGTLPGAGFEGHQIAELYQIPTEYRLRGKTQASIQNYQQLLTQVNNIHSSHHASFNLSNPLESHLKLADGVVSLGDLLTNRYPHLNEVFLSCCETNLGTTNFTDDLLTLATAFLCSGARSIISTLWMVDDLATCIFSVLYYRLRRDGRDRSTAIQQAQFQLRNLHKEQIKPFQSEFKNYYNALKAKKERLEVCALSNEDLPQSIDLNREEIEQILEGTTFFRMSLRSLLNGKEEYPFADPYYWAGFICQGLA